MLIKSIYSAPEEVREAMAAVKLAVGEHVNSVVYDNGDHGGDVYFSYMENSRPIDLDTVVLTITGDTLELCKDACRVLEAAGYFFPVKFVGG